MRSLFIYFNEIAEDIKHRVRTRAAYMTITKKKYFVFFVNDHINDMGKSGLRDEKRSNKCLVLFKNEMLKLVNE